MKMFLRWFPVASFLILGSLSGLATAEYRLGIQPMYSEQQTREVFAPLAAYLSKILGEPVRIVTQPDFMHYGLRHDDPQQYDFLLDAVHFSAFRAKYRQYQVLATLENSVSYTLAVSASSDVVEPRDLLKYRIATLSAPSMGAVALFELYSNPLQQPRLKEVASIEAGIRAVREGKVEAVMVPTPLMKQANDLVAIYQTRLFPSLTFSASPLIGGHKLDKVRRALLTASFHPVGRNMLDQLRLSRFVSVDAVEISEYANLLAGLWAENRNATAPLRVDVSSPLTISQGY